MNIGNNIKALRKEQGLTQEKLAEKLNISYQAVSKWENGTALPDITLLPAIADAFSVTIDMLFSDRFESYPNRARRLGSIYEVDKTTDHFYRAYQEYNRLFESGEYNFRDVMFFAFLLDMHSDVLYKKAEEKYLEAIEMGGDGWFEHYHQAHRQLIVMRSRHGRDDDNISWHKQLMDENPGTAIYTSLYVLALDRAKRYDEERHLLKEALVKFGNHPDILNCAGDFYLMVGEYGKALEMLDRALQEDPNVMSAQYSKIMVYDKMGEYEKADAELQKMMDWVGEHGFTVEHQSLIKMQADRKK